MLSGIYNIDATHLPGLVNMKRRNLLSIGAFFRDIHGKSKRAKTQVIDFLHKIRPASFGRNSRRPKRGREFSFIGAGRSQPSNLDPISEHHDEAIAQDFTQGPNSLL